jgi:hypothetical protein
MCCILFYFDFLVLCRLLKFFFTSIVLNILRKKNKIYTPTPILQKTNESNVNYNLIYDIFKETTLKINNGSYLDEENKLKENFSL